MYLWGINWVRKYDEGRMFYGALLVIFSALMYSMAVGLNVYGYLVFKECTLWANILTSILLFLLPLIQLLGLH